MVGVTWASMLRPEALPDEVTLVSDKLIHAAGYALLGGLAVAAGFRAIVAVGMLVSFGLALELAQLASGYRTFEWADLLADLAGAMVGVVVAMTARAAFARPGGG